MSKTECDHCGSIIDWCWEDAFAKFGYCDGDGTVMTEVVADFLQRNGYEVQTERWGLHNTIITSIKLDGREIIPEAASVGYDDPRGYLPQALIDHIDAEFPDAASPAAPELRPQLGTDVLCELAHELTARECARRGITLDHETADEVNYTDEAQAVFDDFFTIASRVLTEVRS